MKIHANHRNPTKISRPDKLEREVVFLVCAMRWGVVLAVALGGCDPSLGLLSSDTPTTILTSRSRCHDAHMPIHPYLD